MKKEKKCHIIDSLNFGGIETIVRDFCNYDPANSLIVAGRSGSSEFERSLYGTGVYITGGKGLGYVRELKKILWKNNCRKIYSHIFSNILVITLLRIITRCSFVQIIHNEYPVSRLSQIKNIIGYRLAVTAGVKVVCVSQAVAEYMKKVFMLGNTEIIYNGIDCNAFRNKNNRQSGRFVVAHMGSFSKQKNHSLLIEIFYRFSRKARDSELLLIGAGPLENEIRDKVAEFGIANHVTFTGAVTDVAEQLGRGDIFVFPSFYEGFGKAVVEAMALGVVPVTSNYPAVYEIIEHGVDGFIVETGEISEYVDYMMNLYKNAGMREETARRASDKVASRFSVQNMISAYEAL